MSDHSDQNAAGKSPVLFGIKFTDALNDFIKMESAGGLLLAGAALLAMIVSNTPLAGGYASLLETPMVVGVGAFEINKPLVLWINDGLMAIFFFLIGLEVKREILEGELSEWNKAALPVFAAIGGMVAPALVYVLMASGDPSVLRGWAIPAATDIAFALGILALIGTRAPPALKVFLLAVAIIDDLGAIIIIALFYTANLTVTSLVWAALAFALLVVINRAGVKSMTPYVLVTIFMWACVLKSGVHATLAGVLAAFCIPIEGRTPDEKSPLHVTEKALHKWAAFAILPVFAFANAGVSFFDMDLSTVFAPMPLGIMLGLFVGKPIGVLLMSVLAVRLNFAQLPDDVSWRGLTGAGWLTGVGFTMSLFIGGLAFDDPEQINQIRAGVILGSLFAGCAGALLLVDPTGVFDKAFAGWKSDAGPASAGDTSTMGDDAADTPHPLSAEGGAQTANAAAGDSRS